MGPTIPAWVPLLVVPLLVCSPPPALAAQSTSARHRVNPQRAVGDLKVYQALIVEFRKGDDAVVAGLLQWEQNRLSQAVALIGTPLDPTRPWPPDFFRSAVIVHTNAAIKCLDGQGAEAALFHLTIAGGLLQRGGRALGAFASRWVFAASRFMRGHGRILDAEGLLEIGRDIVPDDPIVLYESGLLQEQFATQWHTAPLIGTRPAENIAFRERLDDVLRNRPARLDQAEQWLRTSFRADSSNVMARLHLGRVQMMRRANTEALELLRGVVESTGDRATVYLAAMFTGALHEREGRLDEAVLAYRQAIEKFAQGHSAYLALSAVLQRAGRGDESRAVLHTMLSENPEARREPWSWYFREPAAITRERLEAVGREGRP